jgi:hypothetical protein
MKMTKHALVVGINDYAVQSRYTQEHFNISGWRNLRYCVHDAESVYGLLTHAFGFGREQMILLTDAQATRHNILSALRYLVGNAEAGDVVCFYYAGHGGLLPATTDPHNSRFYEAIIPYTGDWIYDFRLDEAVAGMKPEEVNLTVILDSCHSGGMHASDALEQWVAPRCIPLRPDVLAGIQEMQTLWPFGICLASGSTELIPNVSNVRIEQGVLVDLDADPNKTLLPSAKSTLLAACNYYETAGEDERYHHGYFTQALLDVVNSSGFLASPRQLVDRLVVRVQALSNQTQTPQLRGQMNRMDSPFLEGWTQSM